LQNQKPHLEEIPGEVFYGGIAAEPATVASQRQPDENPD
jgi:hypothetical protein